MEVTSDKTNKQSNKITNFCNTMLARRFAKFLKDILFPVFCAECGKEGEWWCEKCLSKRRFEPLFCCPVCAAPTADGRACVKCAGHYFLDGEVALLDYDGAVRKLIQDFKYRYARELADVWRQIIVKVKLPFEAVGVAIPVPLHSRRWRERGFNQAEIIAEIFLASSQKENPTVVLNGRDFVRSRYTAQQAKLAKAEREENIRGAFAWRGAAKCPSRVILVDDVFTTGATMQECARVLKSAGAERVWGLTLARGS